MLLSSTSCFLAANIAIWTMPFPARILRCQQRSISYSASTNGGVGGAGDFLPCYFSCSRSATGGVGGAGVFVDNRIFFSFCLSTLADQLELNASNFKSF